MSDQEMSDVIDGMERRLFSGGGDAQIKISSPGNDDDIPEGASSTYETNWWYCPHAPNCKDTECIEAEEAIMLDYGGE